MQRGTAPRRQQVEAIVETCVDLAERMRGHQGSSELERERDAIETNAQLRDCRGQRRGQREFGFLVLCAIDEYRSVPCRIDSVLAAASGNGSEGSRESARRRFATARGWSR